MPDNKKNYIQVGDFLLSPEQVKNLKSFKGFKINQEVKLLEDTLNKKIEKGSICIINQIIHKCKLSDNLYYVVMYDHCDPERDARGEMPIEDIICITDITDELD